MALHSRGPQRAHNGCLMIARIMTKQPIALDETRRFYDRISGIYDFLADSSEHVIRDVGIRAIGLCHGQHVLEIGCGTGHGLISLAEAVGQTGHVHAVDVSPGMMAVARTRVESAGQRNVTLTIGDARALCFRSDVFDAAFLSFTLELFETAIPQVLAEVRRVLRPGGRVGVVALAKESATNAMVDLYEWLHRHWPHVIDCTPIDVVRVLQVGGFRTQMGDATAIWGLPVVAAVGLKASDGAPEFPVG
jgi:ubiquinone/menaquinone biosynthesis C-methylase UbiE